MQSRSATSGDEMTTENSYDSINPHGQDLKAKRKIRTKFDNDRINESASMDSQGMKLNLADREYHAQDGVFNVNTFMAKKLE